MIFRLAKAAVTAAALAFGAGAASAATVSTTLYLGGHGGLGTSHVFSDGPLTLTTTGHLLNADGSIGEQKAIGRWFGGLGVQSARGDQHTVDSNGADEVVKFAFNMAVKIEKVWFTYVDWNDDFAFSVLAGNTVQSYYPNLDIAGLGIGVYSFVGSYVSNMFGIGASGSGDSFKIAAVQVSYDDIAPIPLPAAGWLLLAALGGLALAGRRKAA